MLTDGQELYGWMECYSSLGSTLRPHPPLKQNAVGKGWSFCNDWHLLQAEASKCCPAPERDGEWRDKWWSLSLGYKRSLAGSAHLVKEMCRNLQRDRASDCSTKIVLWLFKNPEAGECLIHWRNSKEI